MPLPSLAIFARYGPSVGFTTAHGIVTNDEQCALISADYKLNFTPDQADRIPALHQRVADRMYDLFTSNGGLYIKIGMLLRLLLPPVSHSG